MLDFPGSAVAAGGALWRSAVCVALIGSLLASGCGERAEPEGSAESEATPSGRATTAPVDSAAATFSERVAVILEASASAIERARSESPAEDFAVMADDLMFYRATAQDYLAQRNVPVVRFPDRRPLTFLVGGRPRRYDFAGEPTLDVIVLYEPGREPKAIAPIDIHEADQYFGLTARAPVN